jgi:acetyl esterase/lipase
MLTIELAAHHLIWQATVVGALVLLGAAKHLPGQVGLGISVVSWLALLSMVRQGRTARRTIGDALADYVQNWEGPRVPRGAFLVPFPIRRRGVRITRNVVYRKIAGRRLKLDVYQPAESVGRRPAVLQIHGGAWIVGDKREQGVPLCTHLAANGWVAFNVNYRLSPGATFPDHLIDLKCALSWVRNHAEEYGVDPSFIAVTGGSAGGHLAALMALTQNDPRYQPGFEDEDTSVQAAVPFYGVYDFTNRFGQFPKVFVRRLLTAHVIKACLDEEPEKFREASPIDRVHPEAPPFLVIHGDRDTLAPLQDARAFAEALAAVSKNPVFFAVITGAQHAFDIFVSPRSAPIVEGVERFLDEARRRAREASAAAKPE